MVMARGSHLFSYRTQSLSLAAQKVLGWTRPGRICRCRTPKKTLANASVFSFEGSIVFGTLAFWIEVGEMTERGVFCEKKVVLLRLRGFLHALCLVEMTTKKTTSSRVPFSVKKERHLERSPVIQSVAKHVIQRAYNARRNSGDGFISRKGHRIHATA